MAKITLPDALSRRHLLEGSLDGPKALAIAEAYLEAGREVEAIEFLAVAGDQDRMKTLQDEAEARGDVFLMRSASRGLDEEPAVERWARLAENARAAGREHDAESAARLAAVDG